MKTSIVFAFLVGMASSASAQTWSTTDASQYEAIEAWRSQATGIYENQVLQVETLRIDLNGDGDSDTIFLATFAHEGENIYQQIEIWIDYAGDSYQIYQNSDAGIPYNKIVELNGVPYISSNNNSVVTWINWFDLSQPWVAENRTTDSPTWEELMLGNR